MRIPLTITAFAFLTLTSTARAAEVCGNGQDDDADGLADEGCYPTLTTNQCESPISCDETGMVSPGTGSLRYSLPPDIAPNVPWGPAMGMRRYYLSQSSPGASPPAYRKPLGDRWGHTYMSWLDKWTLPNPDQVVVHLPRGQDVLFSYTGTAGGWDSYAPQTGHHYQYLRQRTTSPNEYQLKTLTGEVFVYQVPSGMTTPMLTEIWDTMQTPNKVLITYASGQVATVADASGKRRLNFTYTTGLLTSVAFQLLVSGTWTTYHTTSYAYTSGNLTSVTIGGQLAQTNVYTSNYLTQIKDAANNALVNFSYDSATPGKVVRVDTPRGMVGYEFNSARTSCSGKTVLYFNRDNALSCSTDTDCGTGFLCGGKTGTGSTGVCFRAARCLTVSSPSEDVVTTVTAMGPPGETCDGACLDAAEYIWNTASGALDLGAVKDPSNYFTVREYNANGLPTRVVYGDIDSNPTNGNGQRELYLTYDATFPGRVATTRRRSDIGAYEQDGLPCSATDVRGCAETQYTYNVDGKLSSVRQLGFTFSATRAKTAYDYTTTYTYDAQGKGRLTQIDGPATGSNDVTVLEYWNSTDPTLDGFLQNFKRKKDATNFVTQSSVTYDFRGNATALQDADGTLTCQTFDTARGYLSQRRETMAGQTSCTADAADLVTSFARDSALRLTQLTRPDGSCMIYEYDTRGRLLRTKRRDDCNAASSGDREEYTYSGDGLLTKIETFNAAGVVTKRQELTYFDSRRLEKILNPVDTSKWTGLQYNSVGLLAGRSDGDATTELNKTKWSYTKDQRVESELRYTGGTAFDTWNLLFDWLGSQQKVTDGDTKTTTSVRDDLGRLVLLDSPDLGGAPTLRVYNELNQLVTVKEAFNLTGQRIHTFTYDNLGRPLDSDYQDPGAGELCNGTFDVPDIVRVYDALPGNCPAGGSCTNLAGRLAYVKVKLMCMGAGGDNDYTLEQETFYSYDAAGRLVREFIQDDASPSAPRTANHVYSWTKNGDLAQVTLPSTAVIGWTYGSAGSNSDTDRITAMYRTSTSTPIADAILWEPYGPLKQYNQQNTSSTEPLRTVITRNLAYRITKIEVEGQTSGADVHNIVIGEDAAGRVTKRDYFSAPTGLQDSWFKYDMQDRVLCETTANVTSCPTSAANNIKNSHNASPPFTAAGDWKQFLRPIPGSTGMTHTIGLGNGNHQISDVTQWDGSPILSKTAFGYDAVGNRSFDDNDNTLTHDYRSYTYDGRRNVINVHGEYYTGGAWHTYDVASAFDSKNRRVFKSFSDVTSGKTATWFFYYDAMNRLSEVRYTADTSLSSTFSTFQLFWLGNRLVLYWQTDYTSSSSATSKRYVGTEETGRPIDMICWSNSPGANCPRVWSINTDAWGNDNVLLGAGVFQPVVFDGQYRDNETVAWQNDGQTIHRPALVLNGSRTYDSWIGAYAQTDPLIASTWSTYVYVDSNPVGAKDPSGKGIDVLDPTEDHCPDGGGGTPPPPPPPCPGEAKLGVASSCPNPPFVDLWKWVRHPFGGEDDDQGVAVLSEDPGTPLVTFPTAVFGQWRCSLDCVLKVPWSPGVELKQPFDHVGPYDQACHLVNSQCKIWLEAIAAASGGKIANYVPKDCPEICKPVGPVDGRL